MQKKMGYFLFLLTVQLLYSTYGSSLNIKYLRGSIEDKRHQNINPSFKSNENILKILAVENIDENKITRIYNKLNSPKEVNREISKMEITTALSLIKKIRKNEKYFGDKKSIFICLGKSKKKAPHTNI